MPLTRYGKSLAAEDGLNQLLASRPRRVRKARPKETEKTMKKLTITGHHVKYMDLSRQHSPERGEFVVIHRQSVADSLVRGGLAVEGHVVLDEQPVVAEAVNLSETADQLGPGENTPRPEKSPEAPSWDDVEGISRESLALLKENAPDADPLAVTEAELLADLGGSRRRTAHAWRALNAWRSRVVGERDEPAREGGDA